MADKRNRKKKHQAVEHSHTDRNERIAPSQANIIVALITLAGVVITAMLTYWGARTQIYGPIYLSQTALANDPARTQPALELTQTHTPSPDAIETVTPVAEANSTEAPVADPELSLNVITPTMDDLGFVPSIFLGYADIKTPGTQVYEVTISSKLTYLWSYRWCASRSQTLAENLEQMEISFLIDGIQIPETHFLILRETNTIEWQCQKWTTMLSNWDNTKPPMLSVAYSIPRPIFDGDTTYPVGEYRHDIRVFFRD